MLNLLRYVLANVLWTLQCWGWLRLPYAGGRHIDWMPVRCDDCGWMGPLRWCWHGYRDDGDGDVEAEDECPKCGSNQVELEP